MPVVNAASGADALRGLRTFMEVFRYLVDVRGWPLAADHIEDEDLDRVTYDWDADDLGIPASALRDLRELRQMRPLTAGQPWGVFFLEFGGERLPKVQIRSVLRALVTKKRTSAAAASRRTWGLDDLLFIVFTGSGDSIEVHFVVFRGADAQTAEFRELSWQPVHEARRVLQFLAEERLPCLDWPDDESNLESWRARWRSGLTPVGQAISDSARLADRMARTARDLRTQIEEALRCEDGSGPFTTLMGEIRTQLVSDVDASSFADMCAQTLVYGVLTSRMINEDFVTSPVFSTVPLANPFLEKFFKRVHDRATSLDLPGSDLDNLIADLQKTDVKAILARFGSTAKGGDPVIHFYEEFLKKYDSRMRADAGAFYTPQPAVEFMVRAVDEVLRTHFGLPLGIADATPWSGVAERNGFDVPERVDADKPFVSMVDPATGTGTFLVEWLRQARRSFQQAGDPESWPDHARNVVLPSMHAFELMLAPYAIAHLKVALELDDAQAGGSTAQILLTDTLDHAARQGSFDLDDPVAEEGRRAAELKENERFSVVLGNPPYDREQRSAGDSGRRKGGVVRYGAPGVAPLFDSDTAFRRAATRRAAKAAADPPLLDAVTEPMRAAGRGHHLKNVYNDYVYFWCWAVWQATALPPGPGIVAFITASSYLDGISMGGVRHLLRNAFDELWIVDLGGEGRGALKEDNIFDIQTPVAIAVGVSTTRERTAECEVHYLRIAGTRSEKLAQLSQISIADILDTVPGEGLDRMTPQSDSAYNAWPEVTDLFPWIRSGCKIGRTWPISETRTPLRDRWRELIETVPRGRADLFIDTPSGQKTTSKPMPLLSSGPKLRSIEEIDLDDGPEGYEPYGYRSLDRQWVIADQRLIDRAGPDMWPIRGERQVFLTTLTSTKLGQGPAVTATPYVPDLDHFRGSYGAKNVMPLHRNPSGVEPNVSDGLLAVLSEQVGGEASAEDLLAYVYALAGTAAFSVRFNDELAEAAGPIHIPITADPDLFWRAVTLGRDLLWWHTWGERFAPEGQSRLPEGQAMEVDPVEGMPDDFDYDPETLTLAVGTGAFAPVSPEAWDFEVSGLRVLRSWLGYRMKTRKGRKSSPLDDIRPTRWTQSNELLLVLSVIEHTVEITPKAAALLDQIVNGPLIPASDLPTPTAANRKPPRSSTL